MTTLHHMFGDLRSLLHEAKREDVSAQVRREQSDELWGLMQEAFDRDPGHYRERWRPYLDSFQRLREQPVIQVHSLGELELAADLAPSLGVHLNLREAVHKGTQVKRLAKMPQLEHVVELSLRNNRLVDRLIERLAKSKHAKNIRTLDLAGNQIHNEGFIALMMEPGLGSLERLCLLSNNVGDSGVAHVSQRSKRLAKIQWLDLRRNRLMHQSQVRLMRSKYAPQSHKAWFAM